jgi:hypothetical protein
MLVMISRLPFGRFIVAGLMTVAVSASAEAASRANHDVRKYRAQRAERDCVPINGRYGYYGNPWCDTGSTRPPDMEFRERQRQRARWRR